MGVARDMSGLFDFFFRRSIGVTDRWRVSPNEERGYDLNVSSSFKSRGKQQHIT